MYWGVVIHTSNPSVRKVETQGSEVQSHPQLHKKSEASLEYMCLCLKTKQQKAISTYFYLIVFLNLLILNVYGTSVPRHVCVGQRMNFRHLFFPSTVGAMGRTQFVLLTQSTFINLLSHLTGQFALL